MLFLDRFLWRALLVAALLGGGMVSTAAPSLAADDQVPAPTPTLATPTPVGVTATPTSTTAAATPTPTSAAAATSATPTATLERWTAYGFSVVAPANMWPMLELLHAQHFDWELASASRRPTPIVWSNLPTGVYGSYLTSGNVVRLSRVLQTESVELGTAFLAHELTHLNDDLNGRLGDATGDLCYEAETRAFVNEANFWQMVFGPRGKVAPDAIEDQENQKMFAFVGNERFADLVVRTTPSYVTQCGSS
jgi:hypothetical protein